MRAALLAAILLALALAPFAAQASHETVLLDEGVAPADELVRLVYSPREPVSYGRLRVECPGGALVAWEQSNVTDDAWVGSCVGAMSWDLPKMGHGAGYAVTVYAAAEDARVLVTGAPWWEDPADDRPYAFLWAQEGPDFHVHPSMLGSFVPATDLTDVSFVADASGWAAELVELEPAPRIVAYATSTGDLQRVEDLAAGRQYYVRMSVVGTCQPECFAPTSVEIRAWPRA